MMNPRYSIVLASVLLSSLGAPVQAAREGGTCPAIAPNLIPWKSVEIESPSNQKIDRTYAIAVVPGTGTLYNLPGRKGLWKSLDQGSTWEQIADDTEMAGALWYGIALHYDPETGGLAAFLKDPMDDPVQSAVSLNEGQAWHPVKRLIMEGDKLRSYGWSWGQVDWHNNPKRMLAKMHHSSRLWFSDDGGETWREIENTDYFGFAPDGSILIAKQNDGTILRSNDNAMTWEAVAENLVVHAFRPVIHEDAVYWLGEGGLFVADAEGRNWKPLGSELRYAFWGPYFGATPDDIIVATKEGIFKSESRGDLWTKIAENPIMQAEAKQDKPTKHDWLIGRNTFGWDVKNNILYLADGQLHRLDM